MMALEGRELVLPYMEKQVGWFEYFCLMEGKRGHPGRTCVVISPTLLPRNKSQEKRTLSNRFGFTRAFLGLVDKTREICGAYLALVFEERIKNSKSRGYL